MTAFVAGMCNFSSGPWAFPPGPRLPVTRKLALGYFSCIMARNGIVPPSKNTCIGFPNVARLAVLRASRNAESIGGAEKPFAAASAVNETWAPCGGLASRIDDIDASATFASTPGGIRILSFSDVCVRSTLPASFSAGIPSAPVTESDGRQLPDSTISARPGVCGSTPSNAGRSVQTFSPRTSAMPCASPRSSSEILTLRSGNRTSPVDSSSIRLNERFGMMTG